MVKKLFFIVIITCVGVLSCSPAPVKTVVVDAITETEELSSEYQSKVREITVNDTTTSRTLNPIEQPKPIEENRFDIAVNNIDARLFFMNLMSGSEENIVVHPDVTGQITLNLKQVTVKDVLKVVRDIYGYDYKYANAIYTVYSKALRTKIFPINYIDVKRVGVSDTSVLTGNIESSSESNAGVNDDSQEVDLLGTGNSIVPGSRIQTRTETDFWLSLQQSIEEIVGRERTQDAYARKVIANPQTGVVVVTALTGELAAVEHFLKKAQLNIKKQVIIEAKILEIELNEGYQAGINWEEISGQLLLTNNVAEFSSPMNITTISENVDEAFSSLLKISDVSRLLSLLKTQGDVQVLSSPRVSTLNNQKAVIRVGSDRFFVTGVSNSTTTSSGATTNNPDIELSSFFSGISLDVTPQIDDDKNVILHIHPVISNVTEEQKNITVGDNAFSLPLALRDIRESDSIVRAENEQIIVLGGLMQEKTMDKKGKRPILGGVLVVNSLFKTSHRSRVKSELIILLKPIVIQNDSWHDDIDSSKKRIKDLKYSSSL